MKKLHDIIEHYGSDKNLSRYTSVYEVLFSEFRLLPVRILEIGIGTLLPDIPSTFIGNPRHYPDYKPGGSLRAWRDYFPKATVYGGDIADDCMFTEERIHTLKFDSTDKDSCDIALGSLIFDIVVDDGLHTKEAQTATLLNLWDRLAPGGLYVIEDIMYPDHFRQWALPIIKGFTDNRFGTYADICPNIRGNMTWIKKQKA